MVNAARTGQGRIFLYAQFETWRGGGDLFVPGLFLWSYNQTLLHDLGETCPSCGLQGSELSQKRHPMEQTKWLLVKMGIFNQV